MRSAPELASAVVRGLVDHNLAEVRALFAGPVDIDDPFHGRQVERAFEDLVLHWRPMQAATFESVEVDFSAFASGFVATEMRLHLRRGGKPLQLPVVAVSEIGEEGKFRRTRLYYRRAHIDGRQHHRARMLEAEISFDFHPTLRRYQDALQVRDLEAYLATFAEEGYFDGHGGSQNLYDGLGMGRYEGRHGLRAGLGQMMSIGSKENPGRRLEHVNAFSDGRTTVLEFNILRPQEPHVHAGVACYELDEDGLLLGARVYDEAW